MPKSSVETEIEKAFEGLSDPAQKAAFVAAFKAIAKANSATRGGKRVPVASGSQGHEAGDDENINAGDGGNADHANAGDEQEGGEETGGDSYAKSLVQDIMLGLFDAATAIRKAKGVDQEAALRTAFEKAFVDLTAAFDEQGQLSYAAGIAKAKPAEDDGEDGEDDDEDMEKVMAKASGPVQKLIAKLLGGQVELTKQLKALTDARDTEAFAKQAEDAGETAEFAELLKGIAAVNPKLAETVRKTVANKNAVLDAALAKSGLMREVGSDNAGAAGGAALTALNAHATELVTKSVTGGKPMTFQKAFAEACKLHPELYAQHRKGN